MAVKLSDNLTGRHRPVSVSMTHGASPDDRRAGASGAAGTGTGIMFSKVNRETLTEQVARGLVEFIDRSGLSAGDALPAEATLAREFGVSRPVVREALRILAARGLIETAAGRPATVKPFTAEILEAYFQRALDSGHHDLLELMEVRAGLEVQSAMLAARRRTDAELEAMLTHASGMRERLQDPAAYAESDLQLHLMIARASHNAMIFHVIDSLSTAILASIREGLKKRHGAAEFEAVQRSHEAILDAIRARDPEAARGAMTTSLAQGADALQAGDGG